MRIHFIAIGGSAMHNLAIAMKKNGDVVSGSDDEIFEPSASRLKKHGLLPERTGWFPEKITKDLDLIILGMHARKDNPELQKAYKLGLKIFSYPQYLYEKTKNKKRIVIGGSHGKTTVTSMIMHVLKFCRIDFDYMAGANVKGFDTMVNLQDKNTIAIFEGDEYLSSPTDPRPKFHWYKPHIAVITGIEWDHINVFPTFDNYLEQFDIFIKTIEKNGCLFYYENDKNLKQLVKNNNDTRTVPYSEITAKKDKNNNIVLISENKEYPVSVFGNHNMQNLNAAFLVCKKIGITDKQFFNAIQEFKGADKRLQLLGQTEKCAIYLDFAHAPSKVRATVNALKQKDTDRKLVACLELHTFSSLKKEFLPEYKDSIKNADYAIVYFNPLVIQHKRLEELESEFVKKCFGNNLIVFTCTNKMENYILALEKDNTNILFMSSGNFNGMNFDEFVNKKLNF